MAPPILHGLRCLAEGLDGIEQRMKSVPWGQGIPSSEVEMRAGIVLVPVRTPTLPPATHTNCYVIGGDEVIVIDWRLHVLEELGSPAWPPHLESIDTGDGSEPKVLARVVLTQVARSGFHFSNLRTCCCCQAEIGADTVAIALGPDQANEQICADAGRCAKAVWFINPYCDAVFRPHLSPNSFEIPTPGGFRSTPGRCGVGGNDWACDVVAGSGAEFPVCVS